MICCSHKDKHIFCSVIGRGVGVGVVTSSGGSYLAVNLFACFLNTVQAVHMIAI